MSLFSLSRACFSGWLARGVGRSGRGNLTGSRLPCARRAVPGRDLGARQARTGISSWAGGERGGGGMGCGRSEEPGARWIPGEEGGSPAPRRCSSPRLRFQLRLPGSGGREGGVGGAHPGRRARAAGKGNSRDARSPEPRPAALRPVRPAALSPPGGDLPTCARCSRKTTSPRPPGSRPPPRPPRSPPAAAGGDWRSPGQREALGAWEAGGGPAPYCVAGGVERSARSR